MSNKVIRIFASSPGDVKQERAALEAAVEELNTTLRALAPEKGMSLELVRWETHTHPDLSADGPQGVVDEQVGFDHDLFVGVMWTRFGTPTASADSGTEHEFRAAYTGWKEHKHPRHVMFYFCETPISPHLTSEQLHQLGKVREFRDELHDLGLVGSYDDRSRFGDLIRRDLIKAIAKLLQTNADSSASDADLASVRAQAMTAAGRYDSIRASMSSSHDRTTKLEVLATEMRAMSRATHALLPELIRSESPGARLVAVSALEATPRREYLDWLASRIANEEPFLSYHVASALLAAARELPGSDLPHVATALENALAAADSIKPTADRVRLLHRAREELARR